MMKKKLRDIEEMLESLVVAQGRVFYVKLKTEDDYQEFVMKHDKYLDGVSKVYNTVVEAYNAMADGRGDAAILSEQAHSLTEMLTVSKDRVAFWGAGPLRTQDQRSRITMGVTTAATDIAAIKISNDANGVHFRNIKITNSNTKAESLTTFLDNASNGLLVEYCSIHSLGSAQLTATGGSALRLAGDGSEYRNCQIGADTIINSVANKVIDVSAFGGEKCKRTTLIDCLIRTYSSSADHVFVSIASGGVERFLTFKNCMMEAYTGAGGTTLTTAIKSANGTDGNINFKNTDAYGVTDFATAAVGNSNVLIVGVVPTAGTSSVAVTPTA